MALVSIGLPVYNGAAYLRQAIESALGQTHSELELIVCDNASTDDTSEIVSEFARRDKRVRYERNPENVGPIPNFNRAFRLARGEYFKWLAYDDVCMPEMVARCVEVLESDRSTVLCTTRFDEIGPDGEVLRGQPYRIDLTASRPHQRLGRLMCTAAGHAMMYGVIRSSALARTQLMAQYHGSDRALLAELCLLGRLRELPDVMWLSREHPARSPFLLKSRTWDPSQRRPRVRHAAIVAHMSRTILAAPLTAGERALCMAQLGRCTIQRSGELLPAFFDDVAAAVRYRLSQVQRSPSS